MDVDVCRLLPAVVLSPSRPHSRSAPFSFFLSLSVQAEGEVQGLRQRVETMQRDVAAAAARAASEAQATVQQVRDMGNVDSL